MKFPSILLLSTVLAVALLDPAARAQTGTAPYTITPIADNSGSLENFANFLPAINDNGTVAFVASLKTGGQALYSTSIGGSLSTLVSTAAAGPVTSFSGTTISLNASGTIAFAALLSTGEDSIDEIPAAGGGTLTTLATGTQLSGTPTDPSINDAGQVAFRVTNAAGNSCYLSIPGSQPVSLFSQPESTPGVAASSLLTPPVLNASGQVAFITGDGSLQEILRVDSGGNQTLIQENHSGIVTLANSDTDQVDLDATGLVLYHATFSDGTQVIYAGRDNGSTVLASTAASNAFSGFYAVAFGQEGHIIFGGDLAAGGAFPFDGTLSGADQIVGSPFMGGTLSHVSHITHAQVNASGQLVFTYQLTSGVEGIAVATPGAPATLPTISGTISAASISRSAGQRAKVSLTRTGDVSQALLVQFGLRGALQEGVDYLAPASRTKKFKPGKATASFQIAPLANGADGKLTIVLKNGPTYTVSGTSKLRLKITE